MTSPKTNRFEIFVITLATANFISKIVLHNFFYSIIFLMIRLCGSSGYEEML